MVGEGPGAGLGPGAGFGPGDGFDPGAGPGLGFGSGPGGGLCPSSTRTASDQGDDDDCESIATTKSRAWKLRDAPLILGKGHKPNSTCKGCGNYPGPDEPWKQRAPVYEEIDGKQVLVGKEPKGRVCYNCSFTFALAGWNHQYDAIVEYFKFAATPKGRSKHA